MLKAKYTSNYSADELTKRWDAQTSEARYAGADEMLDTVFVAKRRGNSVRLTRKPPRVYNAFSPVFRGKITANGISGFFTMQLGDYILAIGLIAFYLFVCHENLLRDGESFASPKGMVLLLIACAFAYLTIIPHKKSMGHISKIIQEIVE